MLGDVEGALKGLVQAAAGMVVLERDIVGLLQLAEDFRLAEHHGVEAAGDLEQVLDALWFCELIEFVVEWIAIFAAVNEELPQLGKGLARFKAGRHVEFHPIAGRENDGFIYQTRFAQLRKRSGNAWLGKGEPFSQGYGSGVMTQAEDENHGRCSVPGAGLAVGLWMPLRRLLPQKVSSTKANMPTAPQ